MKTLFTYVKNEKSILLVIIGLLLLGAISWLASDKTRDFGLNFFTEILGVGITVIIIDRLIQKKEEKRTIPQKFAAYKDIRLYVSRYVDFWTNTYRLSVPEDDPVSIEDFFSNEGMPKILNYLDMNSEPNVSPTRKWWDWIFENAREFKVNGDKILNRHSCSLDPIAPQKEDFNAILGLIKWCNEEYLELKPYSDLIYGLADYRQEKNKVMPPKCMISINI